MAFNFNKEETSLDFQIVMPNGEMPEEKILLTGKRPLLNKKGFKIVGGNSSYVHEILINNLYDIETLGKYIIRARYHNSNDGSDFKLKAWTGDIVSNELSFKIIE